MKKIVLDASIIFKWLFVDAKQEDDVDAALDILYRIQKTEISLHQPVHWLAEVAAVASRLCPETAQQDIADLYEMELGCVNGTEIYLTASELSVKLNHHLFDTLYHAVALHLDDTSLITADRKYYQKAKHLGSIRLLSEWR